MILQVSLRSSNGVRGTLLKSAAVHLHLQRILLFKAFVLLHAVDGEFGSVDFDGVTVAVVVVVVMVVGNVLVVSTLDAFVNDVSFDGDSIGLDRVLVWLDIDASLPGLLVLAQQRLDDD